MGGDGDLGDAGHVAVEAQPVTDDLFPAGELALDTGPLIIAAVTLSRCQAIRPFSAIAWIWPSRWVGSVSAVALSTASARGGSTITASG
jgi:hypothetical protein